MDSLLGTMSSLNGSPSVIVVTRMRIRALTMPLMPPIVTVSPHAHGRLEEDVQAGDQVSKDLLQAEPEPTVIAAAGHRMSDQPMPIIQNATASPTSVIKYARDRGDRVPPAGIHREAVAKRRSQQALASFGWRRWR